MKKLFMAFIFCAAGLCPLALYAAGQSDSSNTQYFYLPLQRLLERDSSAGEALVQAARPLPEDFDYASLVPRQSRAVLLGEIHDRDAIAREINHIISALATNKKQGFTHFATEFLPSRCQKAFDQTAGRNLSLNELAAALDPDITFYDSGLSAMLLARERGLRVKGLDVEDILAEGGTAWALTPPGLKTRNEAWFSIMGKTFRQEPLSRFIVHCGSLHSQYNIENSLGRLLKSAGTKPLVILFETGPDVSEGLNCDNISFSSGRYSYGWYEFFCRYGLAEKNLILKLPPRYAEELGMDILLYLHNHNALRDMAQKDMERMLKETGFFKYKNARTHPDSSASQMLRRATFSD